MKSRINHRIVKIADELRKHFFESSLQEDDISIFLCGGSAISEDKFRRNLGSSIAEIKSKYRYSVFYPEDMFVELILGHKKTDLLTLENLLASSVSATVILVQSAGTFTELGAFSNHPELNKKLIVVIDPIYRKSKSFIISGPVKHLEKYTSSIILYQQINDNNLNNLKNEIADAARIIKSKCPPIINLTNTIICYEFYLALIYIFDPIPINAICFLAEILEPKYKMEALTAAETVVNGLVNQRDAMLVSGNMHISQKGIQTLFNGLKTKKRNKEIQKVLSDFRVDALNVTLRKRWKGVWGEAAHA